MGRTLASVEASQRRRVAAPPEAPDVQVEEIRRSTTEAITRTGFVEQAIQEVVAFSAR